MILDYESAESDLYELSEEQLAEIQRRLDDENAPTVSLKEFLERIKALSGEKGRCN